ncbi:hypothetical protein K469DRAFT_323102 [Zopfia rhizophila CBS 207.26]|uniref:Uncharacterized protein n=1 Tax=Zopfia rhizophila CBS 207.26 TaxID=1314779 RepID=A0A6A6DHY6_9PEZI|nr:hypothetical protein K469DRAFT_323102 [Zopfia rhizophila CBS 207.26]
MTSQRDVNPHHIMNSAQILYMSRSPSAMKPHHLTIPNFSDADIWGASMGTTDLNDYPWKMDAGIASGGNQEVLSPIDAECDQTAHMEEHANIRPRDQAPEQQVPNLVTEDIREAPTETNIGEVNDVETAQAKEPQYIRPEISKQASGVAHPMQVHETITREQPTEDADTRDAGPEIDGPLVAEARPTEQQSTEDTVGDVARERVIPHELEPREDLSPLYDREIEEINEESTAPKKHSGHGGEVCKGWRPRKRLRGTKGTSIGKQSWNAKVTLLMYELETAIVVDDDNEDDDKEIRRSTRTTIPPNQPGMVRWADPSFNKTAAEDFYRFWHAIKICWVCRHSVVSTCGVFAFL